MNLQYDIVEHTTASGIRVLINHDPLVPVVALNLWYAVGSLDETPGRTGLAHLFEHLMFSGSAQVASGEHLAAIEAVGGQANATTSFDRTNYFDTVPLSAIDLALWLEADRLATLPDALSKEGLDTQRAVVQEEKRQRYDNVPYGDAFVHLLELTLPDGHPYAHLPIGSMADLDAASLTDVTGFFREHYAPSTLVCSIAGALVPDDAIERVERYFAEAPARVTRPRPVVDPLPPLTGLPRRTVRAAVPQDAVYVAWRIPPATDPLADTIDLGLACLGETMSSRLRRDLVRTGLADQAGTTTLGLAHGVSLALAFATCSAGVDPDRIEDALVGTWTAFCANGPTAEELDRARIVAVREWLSALADLGERADALSQAASLRTPDYLNTHVADLDAVTPDAVGAAFQSHLSPGQRAVLAYRKDQR